MSMPRVTNVNLPALGGRFGAQVVGYWLASATPMVMSFVSVAVFTRLVGVDDYGRFVLVTAATGFFITTLAGWGEYAVLRVIPEHSSASDVRSAMAVVRRLVAKPAILAGGIASAFGLGAVQAGWLPAVYSPYVLPAACSLLIRPLYQILRVAYQARGEAQKYAVYEVSQSILALLCGVLMTGILGLGMSGRLWAEVVVLAMLGVMANQALSRGVRNPTTWDIHQERELVGRVLRFGLPIVGWFSGLSLMGAMERAILRSFAGDSAVGSYGAISGIIERTGVLAFTPLLMVAFPRLVKVFASDGRVAAGAALGRSVLVFGAVAVVYLALGFAFARPLIGILVPRSYLAGVDVIPWLLVSLVIWHLGMYAHKGMELGEQMWGMLLAMGLTVTISAFSNLLLVPRVGIVGVGMARLVGSLTYLVAVWRRSQALVPWILARRAVGGRMH